MRRGCWGTFAAVLFGAACGGGGGSERPELTGNLKVTVAPPAFDGVAGVRINVITIMHDCGDRGIAEQIVLMDGTQPANAFFVVPADRYTVCLTALDSQEQPLPNCSGGAGGVVVTDNLTTEVSAVLNCHEPRGSDRPDRRIQCHAGDQFGHPRARWTFLHLRHRRDPGGGLRSRTRPADL